MKSMKTVTLGMFTLMVAATLPATPATPATSAKDAQAIKSAMSAGPDSITAKATIKDWNMNTLREGSNGWTCLPDRPDTPGVDPWCVNEAWMNFLNAYINKTKPSYTEMGFAYMLMGDTPVSNTDPYATTATGPEDWVTELHAHMMLLVPDHSLLKNMSKDHRNGGPWVMWPDTPYAHIMVPIDTRFPKK